MFLFLIYMYFICICNTYVFYICIYVIFDIYVLIAIFLIVWAWFCISSLVFLDYISPFNICFKVCLMVLNSLNFCLSKKLFIFPSILNEILVRYCNLGCIFFPLNTLNICCHSFLSCTVSAKR